MNKKQTKAFSLFEMVFTMGIFLIFFSLLYPNILIFQKSYQNIKMYVEYRFQEIEFSRMIEQCIFHAFPMNSIEKKCFLIKNWTEYMLKKNPEDLDVLDVGTEKAVFFSCLFLTKNSELKKQVFILYFQDHALFLGEYQEGVFFTADRILLLEHVDGYFQKKEQQLKIFYKKEDINIQKEFYYEIPHEKL